MSKQNSTRVSFAGLKQDRNKQNEITFQNLRTPCHSHSQSNLQTNELVSKKNAHFANFKNNHQMAHSSSSAKFANAIKQKNTKQKTVERISAHCNLELEQSFSRCQKALRIRIQQYNAKYVEVTEMLADLHIKDLMKFNQMIEKNEEIYYHFLNYAQPHQIIPSFNVSSMDDSKKIYEIQRAIIKIITEPAKSFDARSTYQSKNKKTVSGGSSRVSPQITKVENIEQIRLRKKLGRVQKMAESVKSNMSQKQQDSMNSKSVYVLNQNRSEVSVLQDTPQSIKSKISYSSKIKTQKNSAVAMFEKINICQSIQQNCYIPILKVDKVKQRKDHRYGGGSQQ